MNDTTAQIKLLTKWYIFLFFVALIVSFNDSSLEHPLLADYLAELEATPEPAWLFWLGWPWLAVFIASLYGILTEQYWAKNWFIGTAAAGYALEFALPPSASITSTLTAQAYSVESIITGMIIALLLWTPSVFNGQKPVKPYPLETEIQ